MKCKVTGTETPHPNTSEQTLTQEYEVNRELIKRIIIEKKTTLPYLRFPNWKTVKTETEK